MMTMMTMILTTWMDRDRIQHPEGLITVTMQIQAIPEGGEGSHRCSPYSRCGQY